MIDALLRHAGITPPLPGKTHTQCPHCSKSRRKSRERCLMVKDQGMDRAGLLPPLRV